MARLIDKTTVPTIGSHYKSLHGYGSGLLAVQLAFLDGATGSITIEGRLAEDLPWLPLKTFTASTIEYFAAVPYVRADVTAITGGSATVEVTEI